MIDAGKDVDYQGATGDMEFDANGDVAGVIATSRPDSGIDIYMGSGGAPEGVLAAAALRCIGGQMQGRLVFRNDDERGRAKRMGITDFNRKYGLLDLAKGDVMFAATGVTTSIRLPFRHPTTSSSVSPTSMRSLPTARSTNSAVDRPPKTASTTQSVSVSVRPIASALIR